MPCRPRLCLLVILALGVAAPPLRADGQRPSDEQRALEQVLRALEARPPRTARDYRVALGELSLVGDAARPHVRALLRRYVDGPGFDDAAARAFLGDRRFDHPVPEEITFRGHPFLRTVEEANEKAWFTSDEELEWVAAQAALGAMRLHHRRLLEDGRYRAGDQVFANVAMDPLYADQTLGFTWADPYAVIQVGPPAPDADLRAVVETLRTLYRSLLAEYGETLGLRDLMAPWGGGPDAPAHVRSFPDGAPLAVFLYASPRHLRALASSRPGAALPSGPIEAWLAPDGALHATSTERLAEAAVAQALRWFARQESRWQPVRAGRDAISEGFAQWFAARVAGPDADLARLADVRAMAEAFAERGQPYPVFPLETLLGLATDGAAASHAAAAWGVPPRAGIELFRDQAWALVRMLQREPTRDALLAWLQAWLRRETEHGQGLRVFERLIDLRRDDGDWKALEADWQRYVAEEILGTPPAVAPRAPGPRPLVVEVGHWLVDGERTLVVLLRDPEGDRQRPLRVVLPAAPSPADRIQPLLDALDAVSRRADGGRHAVRLGRLASKLRGAELAELRLVLVALLVSGHEEISADNTCPPEIRGLLDALRAAGTETPR